jgi:hypothetical protein
LAIDESRPAIRQLEEWAALKIGASILPKSKVTVGRGGQGVRGPHDDLCKQPWRKSRNHLFGHEAVVRAFRALRAFRVRNR